MCVESCGFPLSVSLSSPLVAIKTMRVWRQYWIEKKSWQNSEKGNSLSSYLHFSLLFCTFLKLQVLHLTGIFTEGLLFSRGHFDQLSTSRFCWSLPVLWGLQVKPRLTTSDEAGQKPCSGAGWTGLLPFCLPQAASLFLIFKSKHKTKKNAVFFPDI